MAYVATAESGDDPEMVARIAQHRADRPAGWRLIEEPLAIAAAVDRAAQDADVVLVDCLTIWLSNLFYVHRGADQYQIQKIARDEITCLASAARQCHLITVTNELGCGPVPEPAVTRAFRDVQGFINQRAAEVADEVILTVAGLPLYLKGK